MSSPVLEAFLARLYTDEAALAAFLAAPDEAMRQAGLDTAAIAALRAVDRDSLVMAARSFRAKRTEQVRPRRLAGMRSVVSRARALLTGRHREGETGTPFRIPLIQPRRREESR